MARRSGLERGPARRRPEARRPSVLTAAVAFAFSASVACSAGPSSGESIVHDSAGVRIIEHPAGLADRAPEWTLTPRPVREIGLVDGPEAYRLFRVADARMRDDGAIAVLNFGTREVRLFGPGGMHLRSIGREGEGPGELSQPTHLALLPNDSIFVWDGRLRRATVFDGEGRVGRIASLTTPISNPALLGVFADGTFVITDERLELPSTGFADAVATYVRYTADGTHADSLGAHFFMRIGHFPGLDLVGGPLFEARGVNAASQDRFWVGTGRTDEIREYLPDGSLQGILRWTGPDRRVRPEHVRSAHEAQLAGTPEEHRPRTRALHDAQPIADVFPAYAELLSDAGGRLWVQAYRMPTDEGPTRWTVLDPDGQPAARVETPRRLRITEIGEDWILGVEPDDLDVERVRVYGLVR